MLIRASLLVLASVIVGCSDGTPSAHADGSAGVTASSDVRDWELPATLAAGSVTIDGSSTVFPLTLAVKQGFESKFERVSVRLTGTMAGEAPAGSAGGFRRLVNGQVDIVNSSRRIKDKEVHRLAEAGIEFFELPLAFDGISVILHPENDWCDALTIDELHRIWKPGSEIRNWQQIRPDFPDLSLTLYGPSADSGTFDYFTAKVCGKPRASRSDFVATESDSIIEQGVMATRGGLGFLGVSYAKANPKLQVIAIDSGNGPVSPTADAIASGRYAPFSRPLFMYVRKSALDRPQVEAFVAYYLKHLDRFVEEVGYFPLPDDLQVTAARRFAMREFGTP